MRPCTRARSRPTEGRLLCASPLYLEKYGAPQKLADLQDHNCIFIRQNEAPYGVWTFNTGSRTENVKVHGALGCNDGEVALNWAGRLRPAAAGRVGHCEVRAKWAPEAGDGGAHADESGCVCGVSAAVAPVGAGAEFD